MADEHDARTTLDRRNFFKTAGAGLTAAAVMMTPREAAAAAEAAQKAALDRIAANTYPIRPLFKIAVSGWRARASGRRRRSSRSRSRGGGRWRRTPTPRGPLAVANAATAARANLPNAQQMKEKYGEITMLDFPAVHEGHVPGRDADGPVLGALRRRHRRRRCFFLRPNGRPGGFDPLSPSGRSGWRSWPTPGEDRHEGPAHLQQRAVEPGRVRVAGRGREAQGRRRDGQAVAQGLRGARRQVDAHELAAGARPQHPAQRDRARARRRLSAQHRPRAAAGRRPSSRTRRWRTTAAISASR